MKVFVHLQDTKQGREK